MKLRYESIGLSDNVFSSQIQFKHMDEIFSFKMLELNFF